MRLGINIRDEFATEEYVVNLKNGIFNLKTGTFQKHTPDYLSRVQIPIYYDDGAMCPRFDVFLDSSMEGKC